LTLLRVLQEAEELKQPSVQQAWNARKKNASETQAGAPHLFPISEYTTFPLTAATVWIDLTFPPLSTLKPKLTQKPEVLQD